MRRSKVNTSKIKGPCWINLHVIEAVAKSEELGLLFGIILNLLESFSEKFLNALDERLIH